MTNTAHYCAEQCTRSGALRSSLRISDRYGSYSAHCKNIRQTESIWSITVNFISCLICMIRVFFIHTLFSDKSQGINSCSSSRTTSGMGLQFQFVGFERMENFRSTKKSAIDYWFPIKSVFFYRVVAPRLNSRTGFSHLVFQTIPLASYLSSSSSFLDIYNPP